LLAGRYGLLTVSIPRTPSPGQVVKADALPPEPVEIWRKEIQTLRACVELLDSIANRAEYESAREHLNRKIAEHLARVPFHLKISGQSLRYCPVTLSAAPLRTAATDSLEMLLAVTSASAPTLARTERFGGIKSPERR
jgi:hypothetical protein